MQLQTLSQVVAANKGPVTYPTAAVFLSASTLCLLLSKVHGRERITNTVAKGGDNFI